MARKGMKLTSLTLTAFIVFASVALLAIILISLKNSLDFLYNGYHHVMKRRVTNSTGCHTNRLLVVSFDGFRWNYLTRTDTPNFHKFIHNGVQAQYGLNNAFITKTFPNHYTLATGLWEENHQIVANNMYDPVLNMTFSPSKPGVDKDPAWFDAGGEPIWVTNQLHGNGHSGVLMWVGNEAPVHDTLPTKLISFDPDFKNETKIDTLINWFKNDCQMNLGMTYFPQPDRYGHQFGPESEQVTRMIGGLDELVGYLLKRFEEENLLESTNIILTSDHGFAATSKKKHINLDEIIKPESCFISDITPVAAIWPHEGYFDDIFNNLTNAATQTGHFIVYRKGDIPEHFHYKQSHRIAPIIALANEYYSFSSVEFGPLTKIGDHGYDNRLKDMHPFFLAMGPAFKAGFAVESFDSVDVYPLMCHILGVEPSPNNGSMKIVSSLLKSHSKMAHEDRKSGQQKYLVPLVIVACILVVALTVGTVYTIRHIREAGKKGASWDELTALDDEDTVVYSSETVSVPLL